MRTSAHQQRWQNAAHHVHKRNIVESVCAMQCLVRLKAVERRGGEKGRGERGEKQAEPAVAEAPPHGPMRTGESSHCTVATGPDAQLSCTRRGAAQEPRKRGEGGGRRKKASRDGRAHAARSTDADTVVQLYGDVYTRPLVNSSASKKGESTDATGKGRVPGRSYPGLCAPEPEEWCAHAYYLPARRCKNRSSSI